MIKIQGMVVVMTVGVTLTLSASVRSSSPASTCPPGMYYDPVIDHCDYCGVICEYAEIQDTLEQCRSHCPDYLSPKTNKHQSPISEASRPVVTQTADSKVSPESVSLLSIVIIALCVVTVMLVCLVAGLVVWRVRRNSAERTLQHSVRKQEHLLYSQAQPMIYQSPLKQPTVGEHIFLSLQNPES